MGFLCLLAWTAACAFAQNAQSQWRPLHSFGNGAISAVYFLDDQSAPNIGFVGCGDGVYRSGDGGISWSRVFTLPPSTRASAFAFKSSRVGWMSVMSITGGGAVTTAAYVTNDGGDSWIALPFIGEASDVFYNRFNNRLLLSDRAGIGTSKMSSNDGKTWTSFGQANQNGFASADVYLILSAVSIPYMQSTDGGVTWTSNNYTRHSWSPCVQPGTQNFYAAEDIVGNIVMNTALQGWKLDASPGGLTGCMQANACAVFAQSFNQGLYEKATGDIWRNIGGPGNAVDTRFQAIGTHVYAGDDKGNLFVLDVGNSPWPSLLSSADSLSVVMAVGCSAAKDSLLFSNFSCLAMTIDSASIDDPSWKILAPKFPQALASTQALRFQFLTSSSTPGSYPTTLHLHLHSALVSRDTTIPLTLKVTKIVPPGLHAMSATTTDHCSLLDTVVTIHNKHCGPVTLTRLQNNNTAVFRLGAIALPKTILADSTLQIPLQIRPNVFGATRDTLQMTLVSPSAQFDTSTPLQVFANRANISAAFSASTLDFDTITPCRPARRTVMLKNSSCDSAQIAEIFVYSSNRFRVLSPSLSSWIAGGDSVPFVIEFENAKLFGPEKGTLRILLTNPEYQSALQLELNGYTAVSGAEYTLSTPTVPSRSICDADTLITITLANSGCDSLHYRSSGLAPSTTFSLVRSIDTLLAPGDSATLRIRVHASAKGLSQCLFHASVTGTSDTASKDILIPLAVTFTRGTATATLSTDAIDLGRTSVCEERDTFVVITNTGCDTVCITNLDLTGSGFVLRDAASRCLAPNEWDTIYLLSKIDTLGRPGRNNAQLSITSDAQNSLPAISIVRSIDYPTSWHATLGAPTVANGIVTYRVTQSGSLPNDASGLQYDVRYSDDMLEFIGVDEAAVQMAPLSRSLDSLDGQRLSSPILTSPVIATLHFKEYMAASTDGFVTLRNPVIMSSANRAMDCIAVATLDSTKYSASLTACGGDYMRDILNDQPILIQRVAPNPTSGKIQIDVLNSSTSDLPASFCVDDALGRLVHRSAFLLAPGKQSVLLDLQDLPSGMYSIRVEGVHPNSVSRIRVIKD